MPTLNLIFMIPAFSTLVTSLPAVFYNKSIGLVYSAGLPLKRPIKSIKYELLFGLKI